MSFLADFFFSAFLPAFFSAFLASFFSASFFSAFFFSAFFFFFFSSSSSLGVSSVPRHCSEPHQQGNSDRSFGVYGSSMIRP
ncbi:Uncharacterised protein [Mycobacterium tuberculosis]|nr:Uncharacterised protein [Mycobacterium tuberculosis]